LRRSIICVFGLLLLTASSVKAQVQVGDDLRMNMNGLIDGGYSAAYGDGMPSNHSLLFGGSAQVNGSYYDPNFLNFTATPYYNQSRADSAFQSLTNASGLDATANIFTGSRFPGFATYHYDRNSTGTFALIGTPNFTTIGTSQGFGIGWSALLPDWPTFSVSYSQGTGTGTLFGTNQESSSTTRTLNVRSTYQWEGWHLSGNYTYMDINSEIPLFLSGEQGNNFYSSTGNDFGFNGTHPLPWHGTVSLGFLRTDYSGDYGSTAETQTGVSNYTIDQQTALVSFHPTLKLGLFVNESYTDNLNGFLYQSIANNGGGVPLLQSNSQSNSFTLDGGVSYNFTKHLYGTTQINYFDQTYFGKNYEGSFLSATLGYGKRILDTFTVSATAIESSNKFSNNALGFIVNLNAFRHLGLWEASGNFNYAQNVQTLLVTYTTSYYNYSGNVHRRLGRGTQWTAAFNGTHSGFSQQPGTDNHSEAYSTSLALRRFAVTGNYTKSRGQSILTSIGIQPITTPGLPPIGLIVYNAESYSAGISTTPLPRLTISGTYSHAMSDTLSSQAASNNRTVIFYAQLQYRLRQITVLSGYTKFSQGISAAGVAPGNQYSYFIGVTRSINFF